MAKHLLINKRLIFQTLVFVIGLSTAFVLLGFGAGAIGKLLNNRIVLYVSGAIVIILGLHQIGLFKLKFLERTKKVEVEKSSKGGVIGAYFLGLHSVLDGRLVWDLYWQQYLDLHQVMEVPYMVDS